MSEHLSADEFLQAMRALLETVHWTTIAWNREPENAVYATHEGSLHLPHLGTLRCYQLNTGERVFDADDVERLLGLEDETEEEDA